MAETETDLRLALGIVPDADTAVMLCEVLLDSGCNRERIWLITAPPPSTLSLVADRFPLLELTEIHSTPLASKLNAYIPAPQNASGHLSGLQATRQQIVDALHAMHTFIDTGTSWAWSFYERSLNLGNIILAVRIDGVQEETQLSKLILANSVDRFVTMNISL